MKDGCVIKIRKYESKNPGETSALKEIWNEVVEDGNAFPQTAPLKSDEEANLFSLPRPIQPLLNTREKLQDSTFSILIT